MKKQHKILFLFLIQNILAITIYAQGGTWTWISGSSNANALGVFGTQGIPSVNNHPPAVYEPCEWKDKQGNFWIYGGTYNSYCDLWKFNPTTLEWTWVKGSGLQNMPTYYGTKGVANISNSPGVRSFCSITWVDTSGNFWIFGGANSSNALWKYDIANNMWTWVNGTTNTNAYGVYGIKGVPAASNVPGIRKETCSGWTDSLNNLWLFGGFGNGVSALGYLDDLWKYNIATNEWTWMAGDFGINKLANYGVKGVSSATNNPGGRMSYTKWKDAGGSFWIFGGSDSKVKNDVWKYQPDINQWVWMNGKSTNNDSGYYNSFCAFDSTLLPFSRFEHRSSVTDNCGNFWMYGGFRSGAFPQNDLWFFDPQILQWKLLNGTNKFFQPGNYGLLGVPSVNNAPPSRGGASAWWCDDNKFYMFGGLYSIVKSYADVWVFDPDTNCISFNCNNSTSAIANFSSSDSLFCEKQCIDFTDISQNNPTSWQWTFNGASPSTSTDQNPTSICYNSYGSFDVTLVACNQFGCDTITKNNFITSYITPFDSIWFANDTLFALPAYSYQWYAVGAGLIANATQNYYVPLTLGSYYCTTKDSDGCEATSNVILYTSFFENENNELANAVWPNPANEILFVNPQLLNAKNIIFEIYDMQGRIILQQMLSNNINSINISQLATSVYSYRIMTIEKIIAQGKFVKQIKN
ncbi:MAG TPA: kelch repeat-containing protein [Bacteroidia bacterium]|nr:kelch repeat-containing protein [Bacteroidia bacterium]